MTIAVRMSITAVILHLLGSPALAQGLPLTLEDAIRRGIGHAPRLAEARARETSAEAVVAARAALGKPTAQALTSFLRTNHVEEFGVSRPDGATVILFPDVPSNYRARAELVVPVYTGGRVDSAVAAARADVRAAEADGSVLEQEVRLEVTRTYLTLVTAREAERVLVIAVERADAYVGDVRARVDAGVLPPNDLLSAQAQRAREAVRLVQARNAAATTSMRLARLLGEDLARPIEPLTPVTQPLAADLTGQPAEALIARAIEHRAERTGLTERQAALRSAGEAAIANLRPQVGALAAVEPARPNQRFVPRMDRWNTSWDLGVTLTWPLFDGGKARADRAANLAQAQALTHRLEDFDAGVAFDVRQRLLDLESGRAALTASGEGLAAAAEARRVVEERFRAGVATGSEVLDAQLALVEAELEQTRLTAALRLSEADLLRAVGGR
jgi:outer membrane protein